jgi:hypothetical protein
VHGVVFEIFVGGGFEFDAPAAAPLEAAKIPFGNRLLTMISVWLGAARRANSPRFDTLAGDAGSGFGRATHATQNKALAQAYRRG